MTAGKRKEMAYFLKFCKKEEDLEGDCWSRIGGVQKRAQKAHQGKVTISKVTENCSWKGESGKLISTTRQGRDEERLPKQKGAETEDDEIISTMKIHNLINNGPFVHTVYKVPNNSKGTSLGKPKHLAAAKKLTEMVEHYDLLSSLAQTNEGISFGQSLRRNAKGADTMFSKPFRGKTERKIMAIMERWTVRQAAVFDDSKRLNLVEVSVVGITAQVLCNSGDVPNIMAARLCSQLHIQPYSTNREIKMTNGSEDTVPRKVKKVPTTVRRISHVLAFSVGKDAPFSLIIKILAVRTIRASSLFDKNNAIFGFENKG